MMFQPEQLWMGACVGAQMLVVLLCVIQANEYRERPLLLHAAATLLGILTLQSLLGGHPVQPRTAFLFLPALAGLQLLDLAGRTASLRPARRGLLAASALLAPLGALGSVFHPGVFLPVLGLWLLAATLLLVRAWRASGAWLVWQVPALLALALAGAAIAGLGGPAALDVDDVLRVAGVLTLWTSSVYLSTLRHGRQDGETRARVQARKTVDPLTGLATPLVLVERVHAARHLSRRYGHPSVLMLVAIENLAPLAGEFGPEVAESAVLAAASRVRDALQRDGDVAARVSHSRFGVLAAGAAPEEAAAAVASRILVAGLREPLPAAPSEFVRFRIVMAAVPQRDIAPKELLQRLGERLDLELQAASERRIVTVAEDELVPVDDTLH